MKIIQGESLEEMKKMEENSVDTIITDPPYGLSFMGKKWDYDVPSVELWKEALRVLKPGGTALIFAGSRTQHRMAVNVEDAGFILKDTIMWLYGSGFPKATDISKQLDKGHEREVIKINKKDQRPNAIKNNTNNTHNAGFKPGGSGVITEPSTPEAKLWNGWKSHGLKPAYEPILVAMKPNDGTYANNALKHGVAGLNIDGGRIVKHDGDRTEYGRDNELQNSNNTNSLGKFKVKTPYKEHTQGRFPANIILDDEAGKMLDEQSGELKVSGAARSGRKNLNGKDYSSKDNIFGGGIGKETGTLHNDKGGASRFFYTAKASKKERNAGCEWLEEKKSTEHRFGRYRCKICNKLQLDHNPCKCEKPDFERIEINTGNNHPTVKPLALMEYLSTLTKTPTGGIVLDPFAGSGTTGVACINTDRDFVLIEREEEYIPIIEARIKQAQKERQSKLF